MFKTLDLAFISIPMRLLRLLMLNINTIQDRSKRYAREESIQGSKRVTK